MEIFIFLKMKIKKPMIRSVQIFLNIMSLRKTVNIPGELGLVIRCLVFVDNFALRQFIKHGTHSYIKPFSFLFISGISKFLDKGTGSGCVVSVSESLNSVLPDSF
jgi:hypothetical protein